MGALCLQVINWLCGEGEEQLNKHGDVADNLKAIRMQQKNFDKFYFTAMVSHNVLCTNHNVLCDIGCCPCRELTSPLYVGD